MWEENKTDDSWNAWVCFSNGDVIGFIVVQTFVHESKYFQWGSPLDKSQKPNTETGEFHDIVEISLLCAKVATTSFKLTPRGAGECFSSTC